MSNCDPWQQGLQKLYQQDILAGYALLTRDGTCESAEGLLASYFGSDCSTEASTASLQLRQACDTSQPTQVFTLLGYKAIVFKQTPCDVYAIARRKQLGVCLNNLPFGMLVSVFQKPQLPQTVIPQLEAICASLRA